MQIAATDQHRALAFVAACQRSGYRPTEQEATDWVENPVPNGAQYATANAGWLVGLVSTIAAVQTFGMSRGPLIAEAETTVQHLLRIGWLRAEAKRLTLSALGDAIYAASERSETADEDAAVVLLGRDDPLAYPKLFGHLGKAGSGLLVDPYIRLQQLHELIHHTEIARILTRARGADADQINIYLTGTTLPRSIEVRAYDRPEMHDRWLIGSDGAVQTLGASLNGIGVAVTVLTPVPGIAARQVVDTTERWWAAATPLPPPAVQNPAITPGKASSTTKTTPPTRRKAAAQPRKQLTRPK